MIGKAMAFIGGAMLGATITVVFMCCFMIGKDWE